MFERAQTADAGVRTPLLSIAEYHSSLTRPAPSKTMLGDHDLTGLLDQARLLVRAEAVGLAHIRADGALGEVLGHVSLTDGRTMIEDGEIAAAVQSTIEYAPDGGWVDSDGGPYSFHVTILHPRASDRVCLYMHFVDADASDRLLAQRQITRFVPLIERALGLWLKAHVERLQREDHRIMLDHCRSGLMVIDDQCRIVSSNRSAQAMLVPNAPISNSDGYLTLVSVDQAMQFHVALRHVLAQAPATEAALILAVTRSNAMPLLLALSALRSAVHTTRHAMVQLIDPACEPCLELDAIGRHYNLTQVERRLVEQLVRGQTIAEAAATMRLKEQTARTYLKQIFQKTGLRRQADLVSLMLRASLPLMTFGASVG